jgi:brefeldin A-inhibited guanine nucleotide-exchange protein
MQVVGLSLRIFILMILHFKDNLKSEIEVFISNIFLAILESENSSFEHKILVLEVFNNLCQDPQLLTHIFLNYDCDLGATSMFKRIVNALAKVAKGRQSGDGLSSKRVAEEGAIRMLGLEGLVAITHSLVRAGGLDEDAARQQKERERERELREREGHVDSPELSLQETQQIQDGEAAQSIVESFDRKQKIQEELAMGILKFNLKPSSGLAYLESHGHLTHTPAAVARFLQDYSDRLDKTVIGDYLGKEREYDHGFCVKVLHEYVDMLDFNGLRFDDAIRHFLSGFRLPGEAQKIDRIMEKFAERYCLQNPTVFPSADTAFILSFSIIMLNTDLHNPSIREDRKMTKEDFIRNNRGISSGSDLPDTLLSDIYDEIKRNPISLKEDDEMRAKLQAQSGNALTENPFFSTLSLDKRRKEAYQREREAMVRSSEALFKQRKKREATGGAYLSRPEMMVDYVRPMFEIAWGPMLSVFAQVIETTDESKMIGLALKGFKHTIRIAAHFNVPTARDLLVNTLYKFTTLEVVKEMKPKNIDCIKALIAIALADGNYLQESWLHVLQCISHLARLQLFASGLQNDDLYFPSDQVASTPGGRAARHQSATGPSVFGGGGGGGGAAGGGNGPHRKKISTSSFADPFKLFSAPSKADAARMVEESNAEQIMDQIDSSMIERVFTTSVNLNSEAIQHFVLKLCEVSKIEVSTGGVAVGMAAMRARDGQTDAVQPRVFSLQKVVEVADFNMTSRSRLVWANVWEVLSKHFAAVGLHENMAVAMYAIDSLRQLSMKFLYKDELRDFNFQRLFLKPFEVIMGQSRSTEIRELLLRCIDNLIMVRAHNIRSGWKSIFTVFSLAASSPDEGISQFAFDMADHLFRNHFDLLIFDFVDLVNCLLCFADGHHIHISLAAISHLQKAASLLAEGHVTYRMAQKQGSFAGASEALPPPPVPIPQSSPANAADQQAGNSLFTRALPPGVSGESQLQLWWPLLVGLAARVADARLAARTSALEALMNTLRQHGELFSPQTWKLVFRGVLFPMLESARTDCTPQVISEFPAQNPPMEVRDDSWILTSTETVLRSYLELLRLFYPTTSGLAPEVLAVFSDCICQHERETLARIAVRVLHDILPLLDEHRDSEFWDTVCSSLLGLVRKNLPEWASFETLASHGAPRGGKYAGLTLNSRVKTAFGTGMLRKVRADGRAEVSLPWATLVTNEPLGVVTPSGNVEADTDGEAQSMDGRESFSTRAEDLDDDEESDDEPPPLALPARSGSFTFAMGNNGTIMTQLVVILRTQQVRAEWAG